MEAFIHAYLELCPVTEDAVSRDALVAHCKKLHMDPKKIDEWLAVYDVDKEGRITLEEFSRGTGIDIDELRTERTQRYLNKEVLKVADDIEIINSTMTVKRQLDITEKFKELVSNMPSTQMNLNEPIHFFKDYLDKTYKSSWQVIVVYGSYCMKFSHCPFQSLQFLHKGRAVLVWRTPSS